jgi:hypothetical protein
MRGGWLPCLCRSPPALRRRVSPPAHRCCRISPSLDCPRLAPLRRSVRRQPVASALPPASLGLAGPDDGLHTRLRAAALRPALRGSLRRGHCPPSRSAGLPGPAPASTSAGAGAATTSAQTRSDAANTLGAVPPGLCRSPGLAAARLPGTPRRSGASGSSAAGAPRRSPGGAAAAVVRRRGRDPQRAAQGARARAPCAVVAPAEEQSQAAQHYLTAVRSWAVEAQALSAAVSQQGVVARAEGAVPQAWPEQQPQTAGVPPRAVPS